VSAAEPVILPGGESGENPLVEGLERTPVHPTSLVIFGATGDLAHRKLLPAIYNLAHEGQLPERFEVIGVGRRDQEHEDFRDTLIESVGRYSRRRPDAAVLDELVNDSRYIQGSFDDDAIYEELGRTMR
jgi:glucose-6-phosphate 1-dehydrogenase